MSRTNPHFTIGVDASRAATTNVSGTERYSRRIIEQLLDQGERERFRLYLNRRQPVEQFQRARVEQRLIPFPRLWTHIRLSMELGLNPVDVLFIPAHVVPPVHPAATVVTVHDLGYLHEPGAHTNWSRRYLDWSTRWSVRTARYVIAISKATKNDLIRSYHVPDKRVKVVHHGIDEQFKPASQAEIARVQRSMGLAHEDRFILFVGTLQPRKNLVRLINAFDEIADAEAGVKLVLAGRQGWKFEEIDQAIQGSRHRDRILAPGHVADADLPALYSSASVVALISLAEGFGLPVLEAMACGAPVLASARGALPEVTGDAAILVDPLDRSAIIRGLQTLLDSSTRGSWIERGRAQASQFSWQTCGRETLDILMQAYSPH